MSKPQHIKALGEANRTRLARSVVKRELREGRITLATAMTRACVSSMRIFDLLAAQRYWGSAKTISRLSGLQIGMTRTVGDLTERQRLALVVAEERDRRAA